MKCSSYQKINLEKVVSSFLDSKINSMVAFRRILNCIERLLIKEQNVWAIITELVFADSLLCRLRKVLKCASFVCEQRTVEEKINCSIKFCVDYVKC